MPGMAMPARRPGASPAVPNPGSAATATVQASSSLLGGNAGDVSYPLYLVNGRVPESPSALATKPGARVRLRIVNAGAETAFRVALAGHRLDVTHADASAVAPVTVDAVLLGMGERVDAVVHRARRCVPTGRRWPKARAGAAARCCVRRADRSRPCRARPKELDGRVLTVAALRPAPDVRLPARHPDHTFRVVLAGTHRPYRWTINGRTYGDDSPIIVDIGRARPPRIREPLTDVPPDAPPRTHVRGARQRAAAGGAQGHGDRPARGDGAASTSTPTTPATGCCTATTPTTRRRA